MRSQRAERTTPQENTHIAAFTMERREPVCYPLEGQNNEPRNLMNQQALSSFIWSVADLLRGDYKQSDYGKVILPFTVLRL